MERDTSLEDRLAVMLAEWAAVCTKHMEKTMIRNDHAYTQWRMNRDELKHILLAGMRVLDMIESNVPAEDIYVMTFSSAGFGDTNDVVCAVKWDRENDTELSGSHEACDE